MANTPAVDPVALEMAAKESLRISQEVQNKIKSMQAAADSAGDWQGKTRGALLEQVLQQRPVLDQLAEKLNRGSEGLKRAGYGFTDVDAGGASGVGGAVPGAAPAAPAPDAAATLAGGPLNFT